MHCPLSSPSLAALEKHLLNKPASGGPALFVSAARNNNNPGKKKKSKTKKTQQKIEREGEEKNPTTSPPPRAAVVAFVVRRPPRACSRPGRAPRPPPVLIHPPGAAPARAGSGKQEAGGALGAALKPEGFTLNSRGDPHHHLPVSGWGVCVGKAEVSPSPPKNPCPLAKRASPLLSQQTDFVQGGG